MKENTRNTNGVFVDLDSLFDTRFKLLDSIDHKLTLTFMEDLSFHRRVIDGFGYIAPKLFRELYYHRTKHVLNKPLLTDIPDLIGEFLFESSVNDVAYDNAYMEPHITINAFPYDLTDRDKETIRYVIGNYLNFDGRINIVCMPPLEITTEYLYKNYGLVIMYDLLSWFEKVSFRGYFRSLSLPDIVFLTPKLFTKADMFNAKDHDKIFEELEQQLKIFMDVTFIAIENFCFKLPNGFKKEKN